MDNISHSEETAKLVIPDVLTLAIQDKKDLHSHYMPFIQNGGIFIPTKKKFHLGDNVGLLIRFVDRGKKLILTGNVVWISPLSQRHAVGADGVGLQFSGNAKHKVKKAIEAYLGDLAGRPSLNQVCYLS
ncbi:MAG: PilZ domain-containing protein [Thiotrichaceae bacterium]|nr:PilZ domain-containing protein [Thiotrichaceae bacterium]